VIHPDDVEEMVKKWRSSLATGELFEAEARTRRADGEYRWQFHRKVPLRDQSGKIVKWYGSSIDTEDRRHAEDALRRSEFYLAEGSALPTSEAGPSILTDSTTGLLNYFGCTASIRPAKRPVFRNT
jgi:hypothetical protein